MKAVDPDHTTTQQPKRVIKQAPPSIPSDVSPEKSASHDAMLKQALPENIRKNMSPSQFIGQQQNIDYSSMMCIESLPSQYKHYDAKLYGRALNVRELKKLANINPMNANTMINDIIKSVIRGVDSGNILVGDKLYIILWLRANTYPQSGYSVEFDCPSCNDASTYDFKVDDIQINYISENEISGPITIEGKSIEFKYVTISDEDRVTKFKEMVKKSMTKYDDDVLNMAASVVSIDGEQKSLMEIYNYINSSPQVYSKVYGHIKQFEFGINEVLNVKCNKCGGIVPSGLTFRSDFFLPPYRFGDNS